MTFKTTDYATYILKDKHECAEITSDGFHVITGNPSFTYKEMQAIVRRMKQDGFANREEV